MSLWQRLVGRRGDAGSAAASGAPSPESPEKGKQTLVVLPEHLVALARKYGGDTQRMFDDAHEFLGRKQYLEAEQLLTIVIAVAQHNETPGKGNGGDRQRPASMGQLWLERGMAKYHAQVDRVLALEAAGQVSPDGIAKAVHDMESARDDLERATALLGKRHHLSWYYFANTHLMLGQLQKKLSLVRQARKAFEVALKASPGDQATKEAIAGCDSLLNSGPPGFVE